ncbi:MAG TPA: flagellar motor switch protein FliN [Solirubrobacteraceae bacterium]
MSQDVDFEQLTADDPGAARPPGGANTVTDLRRLSAVPVDLSVEIGRARMSVGETLELREGSVVTLSRMAGEPVDLLVNGTPIARGEVVVIDEQFGLRLTQVLTASSGSEPVESADTEPDAPGLADTVAG